MQLTYRAKRTLFLVALKMKPQCVWEHAIGSIQPFFSEISCFVKSNHTIVHLGPLLTV